jgi:hypothetical protein
MSDEARPGVIRDGRFYRKSDGRWISRFSCLICGLDYSNATFHPAYRQKKRHLNTRVENDLKSGVSQRHIARKLNITRKTVGRKLIFLGEEARKKLEAQTKAPWSVTEFEFDELETFEVTKCKPLSVHVAVEAHTRFILGFEIAPMKASGRLAKKANEKYGPRPDLRVDARQKLFKRIQPLIHPNSIIRSDQHPHYPKDVRRFFPKAQHVRVKGRKAAETGQGELKQGGFDPIFSLNHTLAMFRYCIASLIRKTWCTTKKVERLQDRIAIYCAAHNQKVLAA